MKSKAACPFELLRREKMEEVGAGVGIAWEHGFMVMESRSDFGS